MRGYRNVNGKVAGFTLVEIIVVIVIVGLIVGLAGGFINFSFTAEKRVEDEYALQSEMRLATEVLNNSIRDASVTFIMPGTVSEDTAADHWSYFGVSEDGTEIVQYVWTENPDGSNGRHEKKVLISQRDATTYRLKFNNKKKTKLVSYTIELDKEDGRSLSVASTLSAINSVAVDYNSSERNPAAVISYRSDPRPKPEGNKKVSVVISMVIDDSGSMDWDMNGEDTRNDSKRRKVIMKKKADALIESFPSNVKLGVVRFADNANNPSALIELTDSEKKETAKRNIPQNGRGGTNAGDGLRRAYHQLKSYTKAPSEEVLYYIILLTDGNPTFYSHTKVNGYRDSERDSTKVTESDYQINAEEITYQGGTGRSDPSENCINYTKVVGENLLKADRILKIRTFVIGFSAKRTEIDKAIKIARNCNPDTAGKTDAQITNSLYFEAGSEQSLGIAFDAIKESILLELWHIYGPYGTPEE